MRREEPQWPIGAMAYSYAGSDCDFGRAPAIIADVDLAFGTENGEGVVGAGDAEMAGEAAGTGDLGDGADEDAAGGAVGLGGDVEAIVHAVDEIDVGVAGGTINDFGAGGDAAGGVGGFVVETEIGLDLGDGGGEIAMDQHLAE